VRAVSLKENGTQGNDYTFAAEAAQGTFGAPLAEFTPSHLVEP
jgi:hypothetical protein